MHTKKLTLLAFVTGAAFFLAGCASNEQFVRLPDQSKRVENQEMGRIYIVRPTSFGSAASMEVWDGEKHIGNTGPGAFLCWERDPGAVRVIGKEENESAVTLNVQPNEVYFIFQHVRMGWLAARNRLDVVSEDEGRKIFEKCSPPKVVKAHD